MAFGTIAVWTESGHYEEHILTKATTSLGRQPGNDIVLNTTAVSRYHAQFEASDGEVYLVDLGTVNGTFLNDRPVEPNSRVHLEPGDRIIIGDVQLAFLPPDVTRTLTLADLTSDITREGVPFALVLDQPVHAVAPGARLNLSLVIRNAGTEEQSYIIEANGLESGWIKLNWREITLDPEQEAEVQISVRPPRTTETSPGSYKLKVRVHLKEEPNTYLEGTREVRVVGYGGFAMDVRDDRRGRFTVALQNQGSIPLNLQMGGYTPDRALSFRFSPNRLTLNPGEAAAVTLNVRPRIGRSFTKAQRVPFAVVARSLDDANYQAPMLSTYTIPPSWPLWLAGAGAPILLGGGLLTLGLLIGLLIYFNVIPLKLAPGKDLLDAAAEEASPSPALTATQVAQATPIATPIAVITLLEASPAAVVYHTEGQVNLRWRAEGAQQVELIDPLGSPVELTAAELSTGQHAVPISGLQLGMQTFTLTVSGSDGLPRTREVQIDVRPASCALRSTEETQLYTQPDSGAETAPEATSSGAVIEGRAEDAAWLYVSYNDTLNRAWVQAADLVCTNNSPSFESFILITPDFPVE